MFRRVTGLDVMFRYETFCLLDCSFGEGLFVVWGRTARGGVQSFECSYKIIGIAYQYVILVYGRLSQY